MRKFYEYMGTQNINNEWTFKYEWTQSDTEDLMNISPDPSDDDVAEILSATVVEQQDEPEYNLPSNVEIDFTYLENTDLIPFGFSVDDKNPDASMSASYKQAFPPKSQGGKIIAFYEKGI